jgi:uncharacterized protein YciI
VPVFCVLFRPTRAGFLESQSDAEQAAVGRHFSRILEGFESGQVHFVGRCEDAAFGVCVLESASVAEAEDWAASDAAVAGGVFSAEVREFRTVFERGRA